VLTAVCSNLVKANIAMENSEIQTTQDVRLVIFIVQKSGTHTTQKRLLSRIFNNVK